MTKRTFEGAIIMGNAGRAIVLALCIAMVCGEKDDGGGVRKAVPVSGPDIYDKENLARDSVRVGEKVFNINDFGAIPDGKSDSTEGFMQAWQATCKSILPARLYVPPGSYMTDEIIFQGPCASPLPVIFQVDGIVLANTDPSVYENGEWFIFENIIGLKLFGKGTFNGQGKSVWPYAQNCDKASGGCTRMPSSIQFDNVTHGLIQGIKSVDPKGFHIFVTNCANVRVRRVKLLAPDDSPNTDGIHISHSSNIQIARNTIQTGDDCISMIQGVMNVQINKLTCGPGHGISIGSLGNYVKELEVRDIRVQNTILNGTENGLRIKAFPDKYPGGASNIMFNGINMTNVKNPIIIDQDYQCNPLNCKAKPSLVKLNTIFFTNIRGTARGKVGVDLRCSALFPCQNVVLNNVDLKNVGNVPVVTRCANIKPKYMGITTVPPCP